MKKKTEKKYLLLPGMLLVYAIAMALIFRDTLTVHHDYLRYFGTIVAELIVIVLLTIFLKKRNKLRSEREEDISKGK